MTQPMYTDEAGMIKAASDYDRISGDLTSRLRQI